MLLKHSLFYFLAKGLPGILSFLSLYLYTRLLAPEQYGSYALILASAGLLNTIIFQWIRVSVLRFLPRFKDNRNRLLSTTLVSFIVASTIVGTIFFILSFLNINIQNIKGNSYTITFLVTLSMGWFELNLEMLRSQLSPKLYGLISLGKAILTLGTSIYLIELNLGVMGLMIGVLVGNILPSFLVLNKLWKGVGLRDFDKTILKELLIYGLPLTATFTLSYIIYSSSRFFLGYFGDARDVGIYSVTYDFAQQTLLLLMMIINLAAYPIIIRTLEKEGTEAAQKKIEENVVLLLFVSLPATVGLGVLSPNISNVLFGSEYRSIAQQILPWITLVGLMQGLKIYYIDLAFQLGKRTNLQIWPVLISAIINIMANWILIPIFGIFGAVYASLISYAISIIISFIMSKKIFLLPFPIKDFLKIIVSCIIMYLMIMPLSNYQGTKILIVQIIIGVSAYTIASVLLNIWNLRVKLVTFSKSRRESVKGVFK